MSESRRLLVVEDDAQMRQLLRKALTREGFEIVTAGDGQEALVKLSEGARFDLVITDIRMPKMDGEELLRRIQAELPEQRVVLMTAYAELDQYLELMRAGAVDYLPKPFKIPDLLAVVERSLGQPPATT